MRDGGSPGAVLRPGAGRGRDVGRHGLAGHAGRSLSEPRRAPSVNPDEREPAAIADCRLGDQDRDGKDSGSRCDPPADVKRPIFRVLEWRWFLFGRLPFDRCGGE